MYVYFYKHVETQYVSKEGIPHFIFEERINFSATDAAFVNLSNYILVENLTEEEITLLSLSCAHFSKCNVDKFSIFLKDKLYVSSMWLMA